MSGHNQKIFSVTLYIKKCEQILVNQKLVIVRLDIGTGHQINKVFKAAAHKYLL